MYVRRKVWIRTILYRIFLRKPRILALRSKSAPCLCWLCQRRKRHVIPGLLSRKVRILYVRNQGATPSWSRNSHTHLQTGTIHSCLSYGKQRASLRRPNKGVENAMRGYREERSLRARQGRFVCAIPGLSPGARIRGLRKKILGWCERRKVRIRTILGFSCANSDLAIDFPSYGSCVSLPVASMRIYTRVP